MTIKMANQYTIGLDYGTNSVRATPISGNERTTPTPRRRLSAKLNPKKWHE
jgi:hypothetical protein